MGRASWRSLSAEVIDIIRDGIARGDTQARIAHRLNEGGHLLMHGKKKGFRRQWWGADVGSALKAIGFAAPTIQPKLPVQPRQKEDPAVDAQTAENDELFRAIINAPISKALKTEAIKKLS